MQKIIYLDKADSQAVPVDASEAERLDMAVKWINRKVETTVHFGLLQIGYYLLNNFFDGDIDLALSRNPHKENSFRRLCQRPDLVISSTHLVNAVKLVVQEKQLAGMTEFKELPVSHKIALLTVKDSRSKKLLARKALKEKLSVRALTREVREKRNGNGSSAGPDADRWSRRLRRTLQSVLSQTDDAHLRGLSAQEAVELDRALMDARRRLQSTIAELRGIRSVAV